jgi:hypothetical protein
MRRGADDAADPEGWSGVPRAAREGYTDAAQT